MEYAILNSEGRCINRCLWDGVTPWQPPEGCTAIADPDNNHPIYQEPQPESEPEQTPEDVLSSLTSEQKEALLALLQQSNA